MPSTTTKGVNNTMNTKIHFNNVEMAKPVEDGGYLTLKR